MKVCTYCIKDISEDATVCNHCGKDVSPMIKEDMKQKVSKVVEVNTKGLTIMDGFLWFLVLSIALYFLYFVVSNFLHK